VPEPPHVDGVRHRWIGANGICFHVAEAGDPDADPVVLLHGWPQHWYEWRHLIRDLAPDHRVIAPDLRGFGWSDAPPRGYLKEEMATDLLALLDALELERVKLVGHDWGGWIGFLSCLRAPERFECFLALGIAHPWQTPTAGWRELLRLAGYQPVIIAPGLGYALHRSGWIVRTALRRGVTDPAAFDDAAIAAFADNLAEPARARACVALYRAFALRELPRMMRNPYLSARLAVPTRLLLGTDDPAIHPSMLHGWEDHAERMSAALVEGCGHFIAEERPELVAAEARALFAGREPAHGSGSAVSLTAVI
jgi:pimeloyl-ACP methyl ester carboxylesterase